LTTRRVSLLFVRDGARDRVDCGGGRDDEVAADARDVLTGCEKGRRG
jgi:hypothetical protein